MNNAPVTLIDPTTAQIDATVAAATRATLLRGLADALEAAGCPAAEAGTPSWPVTCIALAAC